jgi:hypothetical protein
MSNPKKAEKKGEKVQNATDITEKPPRPFGEDGQLIVPKPNLSEVVQPPIEVKAPEISTESKPEVKPSEVVKTEEPAKVEAPKVDRFKTALIKRTVHIRKTISKMVILRGLTEERRTMILKALDYVTKDVEEIKKKLGVSQATLDKVEL